MLYFCDIYDMEVVISRTQVKYLPNWEIRFKFQVPNLRLSHEVFSTNEEVQLAPGWPLTALNTLLRIIHTLRSEVNESDFILSYGK